MKPIITCVLAAALAACSSPLELEEGPEGPVEEIVEIEGPHPVIYDVLMHFSRISVTGDCDLDFAFGIDNPGEISYSVGFATKPLDGSWPTRDAVVKETRDFGENNGDQIKLVTGDDFSLEGAQATASLTEGSDYRLYFSAIEWDGNQMDDRLPQGRVYHYEVAGGEVAGDEIVVWSSQLTLGSSDACKLVLDISASEIIPEENG